MKIGIRLITGFLVISLLLAAFGYAAMSVSRQALEKSIGESSVVLAQIAIRKIDHEIFNKAELFESFLDNTILQQVLAISNREFSQIDDVARYVARVDQEWIAAPQENPSSAISGSLNNDLARELKNTQRFYEHKYKYKVVGEMFVTNKYGAVIASTGRTTDYNQTDEFWWQETKEKDFFVDDVSLDASSGIYGIAICLAIHDSQENFIGVLKAVLNVEQFSRILKSIQTTSETQTNQNWESFENHLEYELFTRNGQIICSTQKFKPLQESLIWKEFSQSLRGRSGYRMASLAAFEGKPRLLVFARSQGFGPYQGLGWELVLNYKMEEVFFPVSNLKQILLILSILSLLFSLGVSLLIANSIAKPMGILKNVALEMGQGNLDVRADIHSQDEVGILAQELNHMAMNLKKITASRDELNQEIAERTRAQKDLAQQYLDVAGVMILVLGEDGRVELINNHGCEVLGYAKDQVIGKKWFDHFLPQKVIPSVKEIYQRIMAGEEDLLRFVENSVITHRGEERVIFWSNAVLRDEHGKAVACLSSGEDITERRKAEKSLLIQRDLAIGLSSVVGLKEACQTLLDSLLRFQGLDSGGIYITDEKAKKARLIVSKGITPEFAQKFNSFDLDSPESQFVKKGQQLYIDDEDTMPFLESERRQEGLRAGAIIPIMDRGLYIGSFFIASHVVKNIHFSQRSAIETFATSLGSIIARIKTEDALKESENCFRAIAEQTGQLVYDYDMASGSIRWSGAIEGIMGYKAEEFSDRNIDDWAKRVHPDDRDGAVATIDKAAKEGAVYRAEYRFRRKDGNYIFIEDNGVYFFDTEGKAYRMVGTMTDITRRHHAEAMIRKSEEKYRVLVESANNIILRLDKEGRATFLNEFGEKFFGFSQAEILGKSVVGTIVPYHDDAGRDLRAMIDGICAHPEHYAVNENQNVRKSGEKMWIAWTNRAIINDRGDPEVLCIGTDISERKKSEEKLAVMYRDLQKAHESLKEAQNQLLQTEKMAAIGQLSAGVAHEVKNPLAIILLSVSALESQLQGLSEESKKYLHMITEAAERANKVVVQLLNFSRFTKAHAQKESLHVILENVLSLAKTTFKGKTIEFHTELINRELWVNADKTLMEQAFFNLIANAADAIVDKGKIVVRTNVIELIDKKRKEVIVVVEDNGPGIPEDIRTRIFEPFFTTKEQGRGTGLGLSIVYTILERHGGKISFESEIGKGTKFFIGLPLV